MDGETVRYYEFGEFRLDARRRVLLKNGEPAAISPRIFDLLLVLVQHEGEVLGHDDLLDRVWDGMFVEQSNLKKSVSALRQILGEHPDERLYVQTVPRRGYSFVAPVRAVGDDVDSLLIRETTTQVVVEEIEEDDDTEPRAELAAAADPQRPWYRRFGYAAWIVLAVLIVAAAAGAWYLRERRNSQFSFDHVKLTKLTSGGNADGAVISRDGKYFLYITHEQDGVAIVLQQIGTGSSHPLTPSMKASIYYYNFTPDTEYVEYSVDNAPDAAQNGYFRVPLLGGPPQRLSTTPRVLSPDGSRGLFKREMPGGTQIGVSKADGTDEQVITELNGDFRVWSMNWSPDSANALIAIRKLVPGKILHYVAEYPISGGKERIVVPEIEKQITSAVWLPDKSALLLCLREVNSESRQIWKYTPATAQFDRVTNDNSSYMFLSISNDGKTAVTTSHDGFSNVSVADAPKFDFRPVRIGASNIDTVGWTADGRLMFNAIVNKVESSFVVGADGANKRQITLGDDGLWLVPRVAADGRSILFASTRTGRKQLWRVDLEGRNLVYLTNFDDIQAYRGKLLADNRTVVFQGDGRGLSGALFMQQPDGAVRVLADRDVDYWDVSPDESMLAYVADDPATHKSRLNICRLATGEVLHSFDAVVSREIKFTRDNKAVTYIVAAADQGELYNQPIAGGPPKLITKFSGEHIFSFDWSYDGSKLAVVNGKDIFDAVMIRADTGAKE